MWYLKQNPQNSIHTLFEFVHIWSTDHDNLTRASNTRVSNVSLSEFSIIMLKRASKVSCRNWTHTGRDYKTKLTVTVWCVSVILKALEHLLKERKCEKMSASWTFNLNHMLSTLMSAVIQLMLNDNRPRTSRQEENYSSDRLYSRLYVPTVQTLKQHVHSLRLLSFHWMHHHFIQVISILFPKVIEHLENGMFSV